VFRAIQIVLFILGVLLALGGERLSQPMLTHGGIACFGLLAMAIGWEAILTRQIQLGRRRYGNLETYTGFPAILQGIQFNLIGIFLIGLSVFIYLNDENSGREVFLQFVRRPGIPLVVIGLLMLLQALVMFLGFRELKEGPDWMVKLNMLFSRMMPGVILLVLVLQRDFALLRDFDSYYEILRFTLMGEL
jgi:hypothetical protein